MRLRLIILFYVLTFTSVSFAKEKEEVIVLQKYIQAFRNKDLKLLKQVVTPEYFEDIKSTIDKHNITPNSSFQYTSFKDKSGNFWVNFKSNSEKEYQNPWFQIIKTKDQGLQISDVQDIEGNTKSDFIFSTP